MDGPQAILGVPDNLSRPWYIFMVFIGNNFFIQAKILAYGDLGRRLQNRRLVLVIKIERSLGHRDTVKCYIGSTMITFCIVKSP